MKLGHDGDWLLISWSQLSQVIKFFILFFLDSLILKFYWNIKLKVEVWKLKLAKALSDEYTFTIPDRHGRGLSGDFGDNYSIKVEYEDLKTLLNKTGAHLYWP